MELNLKKPIAFFDLETTGIDVAKDRIVEIAVVKIYPNGNKESKTWLVNPTIPIPPQTTAIHGISDEKVANEPTFNELAPHVYNMIKDSDLAGFNSDRFDIPLLAEHFLMKTTQEVNRGVERISRDAMDELMLYEWPGNVRELSNAIERAVVVCKTRTITPLDLPIVKKLEDELREKYFSLNDIEKHHILKILEDKNFMAYGMLNPADVSVGILNVLKDGYGNPKYAPSTLLVNMVTAGKLGVKSGEGFYAYTPGSKELVVHRGVCGAVGCSDVDFLA